LSSPQRNRISTIPPRTLKFWYFWVTLPYLGLYCNKVIQHVTCQKHMNECENHTQRVQNIRMSVKISGIAACQNPIQIFFGNFTLVLVFASWNTTCACNNHTRACRYHTRECHYHIHTFKNQTSLCENHTLRIKIFLEFEVNILVKKIEQQIQKWLWNFLLGCP
jgi:hypothetical protein